jgi:hypothetical protein
MTKDKAGARGGVHTLQEALEELFRKSGIRSRRRDSKVFEAWGDAIGSLGSHARAVRFDRGELIVEVESAAHMQELSSFTGEDYRRQANRILGDERIRKVVFKLKR